MRIRDATENDLEDLAYVAKKSYEDAFGQYFQDKESLEIETQERRSRKYFETVFGVDQILVSEIDNRVIAYIQFGLPGEDITDVTSEDIELRRLYVLKDFHGQKIGSSLINEMFAHEILNSAPKVFVEVWKQNRIAVKLYEKYGFEFTGQQRPFYEKEKIVGYDDLMVKKNARISGHAT